MDRRFLTALVIIILLGFTFCSSTSAVETKKMKEPQNVKILINNRDSSLKLSYEDSEGIKNRLLEIEDKYAEVEKINKQIDIFKELEILPSDFTTDELISAIDEYNQNQIPKSFFPHFGLTMGGPLIVSHLTIGGRIRCLFYLNPSIMNQTYKYFNKPSNNSYLNITYGYLTTYVGFSFKPVYVTVIGPKVSRGAKNLIFPFFEILFPCIGFSIAFTYDRDGSHPITIFEYNLDACIIGVIAGF